MASRSIHRFLLSCGILFALAVPAAVVAHKRSNWAATASSPLSVSLPVRHADEGKDANEFETWFKKTFVGSPFRCVLDFYQISIQDVYVCRIYTNECLVGILPHDENFHRNLSLWIMTEVTLKDDKSDENWNRKILGSAIIFKVTCAMEHEWNADDRTTDEWKEMLELANNGRAQWRREILEEIEEKKNAK
jgi:hypothetical protein